MSLARRHETGAAHAYLTSGSLFSSHLLGLHGPDVLANLLGVVLDHRRALPGYRGDQVVAAARFNPRPSSDTWGLRRVGAKLASNQQLDQIGAEQQFAEIPLLRTVNTARAQKH